MKTQFGFSRSTRRALLLTAIALPFPAQADLTWNTAGPNNNWSTDAADTNWLPGPVVWSQNENAIFSGTVETVTPLTLNTVFNNITFDAGFTIAAGAGSFNLANDLASTITVTNAADTATIAETIANNTLGASALTKAGAGTLLLSGANTYTGQTLVTAGTLKLGNATALGANGVGAETLVSSGATLDIAFQAPGNEVIRIAGTGVGDIGALINTGADQQAALNRVELTANASIGGTGRFDIRPGTTPTLDLAGFTLTKVGNNQLSVVAGTVTNGNLVVDAGTLSIETTTAVQGTGTITINSGGTLGIWGNTAGSVTRPITLNNGNIGSLNNAATINSNITIDGGKITTTGTTDATATFAGNISGLGPFSVTGPGAAVFSGTNTYTDGTTITDARLQIGTNIAGIPDGLVTVNGDGTVPDGQFFMTGAATLPATKDFLISGRGGNTADTAQRGAIRVENGAAINGDIELFNNAAIGSNNGIGTLNGVISGASEFTKVDTGTIALTGNNTYTGGTNVAAGTLRLEYSTSDSSKLPDTGVLTLSGGTLEISGPNTGLTTHLDAVGSTTLAANTTSTITRTAGAGNRIALGTITRSPNSFLNLTADSIATTTTVPVSGNLGAGFTVGGTSLATTNGSNEIVAVTYTDIATGAGIINDGDNQVRITGAAGNVTLGGIAGDVIDANSITRTAAGAVTIDTTGKTLRLGSSGSIFSTDADGFNIGLTNNGGNLTAGGADNTAGVLDFNLTAGTNVVRSTITDNGTGAVSVVKSGGGELIFTGSNTYTGGTTIHNGTFRVGYSDTAVGTGPLTFTRSLIFATANGGGARNLANSVVLGAGANVSMDGGWHPLTLSGIVSGSGSITSVSSGTVVLANPANTFTGSTTLNGNNSTLSITTIKDVGDVTGSSLGNVATAAIGTIGITGNARLLYTGTGSVTNRVINLTSTGANANSTIDHSGTGTLRFTSALTSAASSKSLILQGSTAGVGEFTGVIQNNSATNLTSLVKNGSGTWALSATNTYTGGTTVNAGILDLIGTGGAIGRIRGTATVNAGAMLRLSTGDATGYNTDATRLSTINLVGGNMHVAVTNNQTLGSAVINMTSGSLTGVAGSNLDFFAGGSALSTVASATSSTISGVKLNLRQTNGVTMTVLDGAAADDLVIDSVISNSTGFTNNLLTKAGAGVLRLNGANTYTTGTIVNAGTLRVSNTAGSGAGTGAVTVNTGATVGGTGSFTGALTVNTGGTVAPGASAGTLATGAATITGTYACEIDGATADKLAVTGNLTITGATLNVSILNAATQPEYIIATYTGTRTGTFTGLAEGATATPGYTITYATAGQIKLVAVPSGPSYTTWAATFSPNPGAAGVDYEADGFDNGMEFILGGSPVDGSNNPKVYSFTVDSEDGDTDKELIMTIAVPVGTPAFVAGAPATSSVAGYGIAVYGSTTLSSYPLTVTPVAPIVTGLPTAPFVQGGVSYEYRSFSLSGSNGLTSKGFLKVTVTNP